jgi:hypothetical protein
MTICIEKAQKVRVVNWVSDTKNLMNEYIYRDEREEEYARNSFTYTDEV